MAASLTFRLGASLLLAALVAPVLPAQQDCGSLGIEVQGASREYCYTNKATAFLYGESLSGNRTGWQGFNVGGEEVLDDYEISIDGISLDRSWSTAVVRPDYLVRFYPDGTRERLLPFDTVAAFAVELLLPKPMPLGVSPVFSHESTAADLHVEIRDSIALLRRRVRGGAASGPATWLAIYAPGLKMGSAHEIRDRSATGVVTANAPATATLLVVFATGESAESASVLARKCSRHVADYERSRTTRMNALLSETSVVTGDDRFDRALAWAKLSLDALMMNQGGPGIFAGLPWFNNYWGRDTFISLPGAALVTGRFTEARAILASFALHQELDTSSTNYGRIPNYVGPAGRAYNTADGTPRYVIMLRDYLERSGDTAFVEGLFPVVRRSIEGTVRHHMDSLAFLVHDDAETWMDAVGPDGPWSPRGTRANDIQALWEGQLSAGIFLAGIVADTEGVSSWREIRETLRENFPRHFVVSGRLVDHLNADLTPDQQIRPNQIFAASLLPAPLRASVLDEVLSALTYPYGVSSLSPRDSLFHPYHVFPAYYPKDAAYHNGTIWTWLAGPVISELVRHKELSTAWALTTDATLQILDLDGIGTQSELLDAIPRPGKSRPRASGTVSQAWNLAEFIRNFYDDYLGLRVELLSRTIMLRPRVPEGMDSIRAEIVLPSGRLKIAIRSEPDLRIGIDARDLAGSFLLSLDPSPTADSLSDAVIEGGLSYNVLIDKHQISITPTISYAQRSKPLSEVFIQHIDPLEFLRPTLPEDVPTLRPPLYPLISHETIVKRPGREAGVLADLLDPAGDDRGAGACSPFFEYPVSSYFRPGSFDLRRFLVSMDDQLCRFELEFTRLSDPGWHPEYGFQLTFVAIAIDSDGIQGSGTTKVGYNSGYTLPSGFAYERLIVVGGGVRVVDAGGAILGAYMPTEEDAADPFGSAGQARIGFSIPREMLGKPDDSWRYVVLVGAQDDHGGAGLGEFRNVDEKVSEWHGGGRRNPACSNVYDELYSPAPR